MSIQSRWDASSSKRSQILILLLLAVMIGEVVPQLTPATAHYRVHPHPVYFRNEPKQNMLYFNGSTIRLECDTTCKEDCDIRIRYNRSVYLLNGTSMKFKLLNSEDSAVKMILTITNSTVSYSGSYQCVVRAWKGYIVGKEIHLQITDFGPSLQEVKMLSKGDSVFLPCYTPNHTYPAPDHIEWWSDGTLCSSLSCEDNLMMYNGSILLTNITTNMSLQCALYWTIPLQHRTVSHYTLNINQLDANNSCHIKVYPKTTTIPVGGSVDFVCITTGCGTNYNISWLNVSSRFSVHKHTLHIPTVQLSDSAMYLCIIVRSDVQMTQHNATGVLIVTEPPHITSITGDVLIDIDSTSTRNDVILKCVFTGNPTPSVYWRMERSNKLINLTHNSTIVGNTAILTLTITDNILGSYQCIVVSEQAGYISRTTRILPKGLTNSPKNIRKEFVDNGLGDFSVNISWEPPNYNGGVPVQYYKLTLFDIYTFIHEVLEDSLNATFYLWNNLSQHRHEEQFSILFSVLVTGEYNEERSTPTQTIVTHTDLPQRMKIHLTVSCEDTIVITSWKLTNKQRYDDIDGYCIQYRCDTQEHHNQTCSLRSTINGTNITGVPSNTTCWFVVTVRSISEVDSNNVSCYRHPSLHPAAISVRSNLTVNLTINCEENITIANWELNNRQSADEIDGYHLRYWCNTTAEHHQKYDLDSVTSQLVITGVPSNTTCWFAVTVKSTTEIDSNNVSCYRYSTWSELDEKLSEDELWIWLAVLLLFIMSTLGTLGTLLCVYNRRSKERTNVTCEPAKEVIITTDIDDIIIDAVSITEHLENYSDCCSEPNCGPEKDLNEMLREITFTSNEPDSYSQCSITDSVFSGNSNEVCNKKLPPYYDSTGVGYSCAQSCVVDSGNSGNSIVDDRSGSVSSHNSAT